MRKIFLALFFYSMGVYSQVNSIKGTISAGGSPIIGAEVLWLNTNIGTTSDLDGNFTISTTPKNDTLEVRYMGYETIYLAVVDTIKWYNIILHEEQKQLSEIEVTARAIGMINHRFSATQSQTITGGELCKAACCNLSESFETNASVDVSYSDATTGAKQIKMLGLSGKYVQMLTENTPIIRGISSNYGLEYTPGTWMESIQVSKGTSSVINGYEATTGQINVEYLKPQSSEPIALNAMVNSEACSEVNATGGWEINDQLSTIVLAHYRGDYWKKDHNGDGFMDMTIGNRVNLLNRWYYKNNDYTAQFLVRGIYEDRLGGQISKVENPYQIKITTTHIDGVMKNGYVFNQERGTSIGIIASGSYHQQSSTYGSTIYNATQGNAYLNAMFQTYLDDESQHKLTTGISFNFDDYVEQLLFDGRIETRTQDTINLNHREYVPGIFVEYDFKYDKRLSLLAGLRVDYSSMYGFFVTPRFNVRYSPWEWWNLRTSVGLGYRAPNVISDFSSVLASNRSLVNIDAKFKQECALNSGVSTTFYVPIAKRELQITADYYYTHFLQGVIMDVDADVHKVIFYNSDGRKYFAHNFQVEASMEVLKGWTLSAAFRMTDVQQTYKCNGGYQLRRKPLTNLYKGLITTSYVTPLKKWQFDITAQFNGGGRMPAPDKQNPLWNKTFAWHPQLMAQITKYFRTWSIYLGAENMTNFKQKDPIIGTLNPWGKDFDGSMVWAPVSGSKVYLGFRWALDSN